MPASTGDGMPVELLTIPFTLPPEGQVLARVVAYLVHGWSIEQAAIEHGINHVFGVEDILQRVAVDYNQVGKFARFKRTDMVTYPNTINTVEDDYFPPKCMTINLL